jgi:hypothetical protein
MQREIIPMTLGQSVRDTVRRREATRHSLFSGKLSGGAALIATALLCACARPAVETPHSLISDEKISDICADMLSFDVAGLYYHSCKDYLRAHSHGPITMAVTDKSLDSEPAEHKACHEIGLADGTEDYKSCVQEIYQLDLGSQHI